MGEKPTRIPVVFFPGSERERVWQPAVDVHRVRDGWLLKFDLAGVRLGDVRVEVKGCRVTVSGSRRDWLLEERVACYRMEIAYSVFARTVLLPCEIENPLVELDSREGILAVRLTAEGYDEANR